MKKLFGFCFLLLGICALRASTFDLVVVTVTNAPSTNGQNLVIDGNTFLFTNNTANLPNKVLTNTTTGGSATNLNAAISAARPSDVAINYMTNGTNIILRSKPGTSLTVTMDATLGYFTTDTLTATNAPIIQVPASIWPTPQRTNNMTQLLNDLVAYGTNKVPTNAYMMGNYISTSGDQQRLENDICTNCILQGPVITNAIGTNMVRLNVNLLVGTNVVFVTAIISNATLVSATGYFTNAIIDRAFLTNATIISATIGNATGYFTNAALDRAFLTNATLISAIVTGSVFTVTGDGVGTWVTIASSSTTAALGPATLYTREHGGSTAVQTDDVLLHLVASGYGATALKSAARVRVFANTNFTDANSPARMVIETTSIGATATTPRLQIDESGVVVTNAPFMARAGISNVVMRGTNTFNSEIALTPRVNSTVISGYASAINLGTNAFIRITGASGAVTNSSFTGGYSGLRVLVEFANPGLSCVILHHSSIGAPAASEQVNTGTGSLVNMTNNPALFELIQNGTEWLLGWHSN